MAMNTPTFYAAPMLAVGYTDFVNWLVPNIRLVYLEC